MRLVFVNHMHPTIPHVSGMRAWYFAQELAAKGHRVILLCEVREGVEPAPGPERIGVVLREHDWSNPLVIPIKPRPMNSLRWLRSSQTPVLFRKALVSWLYLRHSGVFTDFRRGAESYQPILARDFRPDVVWGILGNTDCWLVAQRLACLSGCSWIGDMKDSWDVFMPKGLRRVIAHRFRDMATATANAKFNAQSIERWFSPRPVVVYSGVPSSFLTSTTTQPISDNVFRLALVGSTYDRKILYGFIQGVRGWLKGLSASDRSSITFTYAGGDIQAVTHASQVLSGLCSVEIHPYLNLEKFLQLCKTSTINAYLWSHKTFHHKLVELLCCRRPIISFPGEAAEALELAQEVNGDLNPCTTTYQLTQCLQRIWLQPMEMEPPSDVEALRSFSWDAQGDRLLTVLKESLERGS